MKIKGIYILPVVLCIIAVSSCYYDKADLLYPPASNVACDSTSTVSYTQKVLPLLQQYCYGCHSGASPSGNITMGTYTADKVIAVNGKLYGTISYTSGFSPMPQGTAKLSDCQVATIKKWIDANSPNN